MKNDKATYPFEVAIKKHLDKVAERDETFRQNYEKPHKSIKECCNYIIGEMRKQQKNGVAALSDEETYGMAIHYYDEDDIKVDVKDATGVQVVKAASKDEAEKKISKIKGKRKTKKAEPKAETAELEVESKAEIDDSDEFSLDLSLFD